MTSKWQRRKISNWLFALVWAAKTGSTNCAITHGLLFKQEHLEFSDGFKINKEFRQLLSLLLSFPMSDRQFSDLLRSARVFCPCKDPTDWQYLKHLLDKYYATPPESNP